MSCNNEPNDEYDSQPKSNEIYYLYPIHCVYMCVRMCMDECVCVLRYKRQNINHMLKALVKMIKNNNYTMLAIFVDVLKLKIFENVPNAKITNEQYLSVFLHMFPDGDSFLY